MATTLVGERRVGSGSIRLNGNTPEFIETYEYIVDGGVSSETRINVLNTSGLPVVGVSQLASGAVCTSKTATRDEVNPRYWNIQCEFSSIDQSQQIGVSESPDPTTWIPVYQVGYEREQEPITSTVFNEPVLNSAGQKFLTPLTKTRLIPTFKFSQYFPDSISETTVLGYNESMNSQSFRGFEKFSLLLLVLGSERGFFNGYRCRRVDFEIRYKLGFAPNTWKEWDPNGSFGASWSTANYYSGWHEMVLDTGVIYIDSGKRKSALDDDGYRIEVGLDGFGNRVAYNADPAVLGFRIFQPRDFNAFLRV